MFALISFPSFSWGFWESSQGWGESLRPPGCADEQLHVDSFCSSVCAALLHSSESYTAQVALLGAGEVLELEFLAPGLPPCCILEKITVFSQVKHIIH